MKLKQRLNMLLPPEELDLLVSSYDVIGDLAVIVIVDELEHRERLIGEAILEMNPRVKVVLKRAGNYAGEFRQIPLSVIAGEQRKETVTSEYGVRLKLNPEKVYYSVRSGSERKRIASLVEPGERILVMFSGAGPYPLVLSRHSSAREIWGIEKNPLGHEYACASLKLNKKIKNVILFQGDVRGVLQGVEPLFDRIVMPLPHGSDQFLPLALSHLFPGGVVHYYTMGKKEDFTQSVARVRGICEEVGRNLVGHKLHFCGHCGPRLFRLCLDCRIT